MILLRNYKIVLPLSACLVYTFILIDYFTQLYYIKTDKSIVIREKPKKIWTYAGVIPGILFIVWGLLDPRLSFAYQGVDSKVFLGFLFVLQTLCRNNYLIYITNQSISCRELFYIAEWNLKKLDKVVIHSESVEFIKGTVKREYSFNQNTIKIIENYLKSRIESKISKE